jgi:tetratricopeptide (TPR) repeat protein/predicted Ser/Thr protein kinase
MVRLAEGLAVGHYRLVRPLGRGGMGEVYLAHDETLERQVAIKFIAPDHAGDDVARRRLIREARAAAILEHPGICAVYDAGQTPDGRAYIVMQYVEGTSLHERLRQGPLPLDDALAIAAQVAEALAVAHAHGVVHRDLKPGNVIVTPAGRPTIVDFGLAKQRVLPSEMSHAATVSSVTAAHQVIGTPSYMAPEQIRHQPLDGRSDLFSLGVLLYECLTGIRPFDGTSVFETLTNILDGDPPSASSRRPELTEGHDALCARLLAKEPDDRFQSAEEVMGAIRVLSAEPPASLHRAPLAPSRMRRLKAAWWHGSRWLLIVVVMIVAFATWWAGAALRSASPPEPPPEATAWYERGTDALRQGAPLRARRALEEAVRVFPAFALAHASLAAASTELDDEADARDRLLRVSALVPDESRLRQAERVRLQALKALVLRDVDRAVLLFERLTVSRPSDPGAWLDLGRAQEAAGRRDDARQSYFRAIHEDRQYAAAHLRLACLEALELRRVEALVAFAEAERLYHAASDIEGETEVLLKRGAMHDALLNLPAARADLEKAQAMAVGSRTRHQQVRAQLTLSSVIASAGSFGDAERMAAAAVDAALTDGLDAIAADGLAELGGTLMLAGRPVEAEAHLKRALQLAGRHGARRAETRARIQLAAFYESEGRGADALALLDEALPYAREIRHRRYELDALNIAARVHLAADDLVRARTVATEVVGVAESLNAGGQLVTGLNSLATVLTATGLLPDALRLRERAETIVRRLGDDATLPYNLANRAELLILLGRSAEAEAPLGELEAGIAENLDSYTGLRSRAAYLRALAGATALECGMPRRLVRSLPLQPDGSIAGLPLAPALDEFCAARLGLRGGRGRVDTAIAPRVARDRHYWLAAAALHRGRFAAALEEARTGLTSLGALPNDQLRWQLALVGAIAAREARAPEQVADLTAIAGDAEARLRAEWRENFETFARRRDVSYLRARAGGREGRP